MSQGPTNPPPASASATQIAHAASLIVVFDGTCVMCNSSVRFIVKHDRAGKFTFAAAQTPVGRALAARHGFTGPTPGSILLIDGDICYSRSTASLQIARRLDGLWRLLYAFILIPRPLRDAAYKFVAARRRKWFGTTDQCTILPESLATESTINSTIDSSIDSSANATPLTKDPAPAELKR